MKIEYDKWGTKIVVCDNWGEFLNEFTKWHTKNKGVVPSEHYSNKEKFDLYVGFDGEGFGDFWPRNEKGEIRPSFKNEKEICAVGTVLGTYHKVGNPVNELVLLVLNLHGRSYNEFKKQELQASKVLREIWTAVEAENNQGLDLNWPTASQSYQKLNSPISSQQSSDQVSPLWIVGINNLFFIYSIIKKLKWI